jgi:hypothetical protein
MSEKYFTGPYDTRDKAAMAGFQKVLNQGPGAVDYNEWGFWVIQKPDKGVMKYYYSIPEEGSPYSVEGVVLVPKGQMNVVARCHTHPTSNKALGFSEGDLKAFKKIKKSLEELQKGVQFASYLMMTSRQEVRFALTEEDFLKGGLPIPSKWP